MAETSKPSRRRRSAAPVNRRTTSVTWGKHASGFDGSFKRTKYGYPSASARLAMQAESSLWSRKRVVGSKLKHDGTLGYISRGAARRSGLNRLVGIVMCRSWLLLQRSSSHSLRLATLAAAPTWTQCLNRPSSRMQAQKLSRALGPRRASRPSAESLRRPPPSPMLKRTRTSKTTTPKRPRRTKRRQLHRQDKLRAEQQIWDGAF